MGKTDEERAAELADWLDNLPADAEFEDVTDLRAVAVAADAVRADEARTTEAVSIARARGRSWTEISRALGVSRQAARQRYADKVGI